MLLDAEAHADAKVFSGAAQVCCLQTMVGSLRILAAIPTKYGRIHGIRSEVLECPSLLAHVTYPDGIKETQAWRIPHISPQTRMLPS